MNETIKSIIVLTVICLVVSVSVSFVNYITSPIIENANMSESQAALYRVMHDASGFEEMSYTGLSETITAVYKEQSGIGYVFQMETTGFNPGLKIICGIDNDGLITGCVTVENNESPGYGQKASEEWYTEQYKGINIDSIKSVDAISGATATSNAYKLAVYDALEAFSILTEAD